jgi:hypothetical protein
LEERLNEIAAKFPKVSTLEIDENEIDLAYNEQEKIKLRNEKGRIYLNKMFEYNQHIRETVKITVS